MKRVKCKFCEHEWDEDVEEIWKKGETIVVRGVKQKDTQKIRAGKKCIDIKCPECKRMFEYCWED